MLGEGGIGQVWAAVDLPTGAAVALKLIKPELVSREDVRRRLLREARTAAALSHPNLVRVHGAIAGVDGGPALVMELLQGESLADRLSREGRLSLAETARILVPVLVALRAMHARGIVHRDLKPANIYLARAGSTDVAVKVLDFGLVKLLGPHRPPGETDSLTASGGLLGTPHYMAPEQVLGEPTVDQRADVFAAGVVLFECLTGARPTEAENLGQVLKRIIGGPLPSLAHALPSAPPELVAAVDRMLVREAPQRAPDFEEAIQLLGRYTDAAPALDVPVRILRSRRRVAWIAAAVLLGAAGAGAGVVLAQRPRAGPPPLAGMAWLPGGTFTMGRSAEALDAECREEGAACRREVLDRERPQRKVTLSPFYLDVFEATNQDLVQWLNNDPFRVTVGPDSTTGKPRYVRDAGGTLLVDLFPERGGIEALANGRFQAAAGRERWPAVQLTWDAARRFCLSRGKRLPTEAEWELAARGAEGRKFPWGSAAATCAGVVFGRDQGQACQAFPAAPAPIGEASQDLTPEGVHDLGGSVSEWVQDAFAAPFYPDCGACLDPVVEAPASIAEQDQYRVKRGGAWASVLGMNGARRGRWKRQTVADSIGVRCAADSPAR